MKTEVQVLLRKMDSSLTVRVPGMLSTVEDIQNITVSVKNGLPIRVADVASVSIGHDLRTGAATYNGENRAGYRYDDDG
jgi:Cu/Ag efflux pump CusA